MKKYQKMRLMWLALMGVVFGLVLLAGAAGMRTQSLRSRVETPQYKVVEKKDGYELRAYEPQALARVLVDGPMKTALFRGFEPLNDYFFWNNESKTAPPDAERKRERISMTTPITVQGDEPGTISVEGHWVAFYLPLKYTVDTAPTPKDERVQLEQKPAHTAAAIRFGGSGSTEEMLENEALLRALLQRDGIESAGPPLHARYDPPWTVPIFRKNEVIIPVKSDAPAAEATPDATPSPTPEAPPPPAAP